MVNKEPTHKDLVELWNVCSNFIIEEQIGCPEIIAQCDNVIENAYYFIEKVCDIVGYVEFDEEGNLVR